MALRSRIFLLLLCGVLAALSVIPALLKSDGTACGHAQLLLNYSLGAAVFLLALASMWLGAGAVSLEIELRHAPLLLTKPVTCPQIWLGKWLGLLGLQAILISVAAAAVYLAVMRQADARDGRGQDDIARLENRVLVAMRPIRPEPAQAGRLAQGETDGAGRVRRIVRPGGKTTWIFRLPAAFTPEAGAVFKFKFHSAGSDTDSPLAAEWELRSGARVFSRRGSFVPGVVNEFAAPARLLEDAADIEVVFMHNAGESDAAVMFRDSDVTLAVKYGGFGPNFLRAALVIFGRLGLLCALGLTAGCVFSFPTAAFSAFSLLIASFFGGMFFENAAGASGSLPVAAARLLAWAVSALLWPLSALDPLEALSNGQLVSWGFVLAALACMAGYSAALAAAGSAVLGRREIGLYS